MHRCNDGCRYDKGMVDKMAKRERGHSDWEKEWFSGNRFGWSRRDNFGKTFRALIISHGLDGEWQSVILCGPWGPTKEFCEEISGRGRYAWRRWLYSLPAKPSSEWKEILLENNTTIAYRSTPTPAKPRGRTFKASWIDEYNS